MCLDMLKSRMNNKIRFLLDLVSTENSEKQVLNGENEHEMTNGSE
jgi:hypothetical protein